MTRIDQWSGYSDKSPSCRIRIIGVAADISAWTGDGLVNKKLDDERRGYGWVWVWGALFVYMALEAARLA
jgi:hypothetical protein